MLLDEFQFATQSSDASARVTQMILAMCYIGVSAVYIANFSLLHKLNSRNQEDRHRLLGKVQILYPDRNDSEDWKILLSRFRNIIPDVFTFDPENDAQAIHNSTGGIKRNVVKLLCIAFETEFANKREVDYPALERAYKSQEYATFRDDVEALSILYGDFRKTRKDLWCPIEAVVNLTDDVDQQQERRNLVDMKVLEASMTCEERKALANLSNKAVVSRAKKGGPKTVSKDPNKSDAKQLQENMAWFLDELQPRT
ncbi:hypothetical protein [Paraburkholderia sp. DGU8]|uniref:hypothetical protein n=1 Tax=Paraburkholderia sp. DGU8 TaxID=3161997 RepID=UPI003464FB5D